MEGRDQGPSLKHLEALRLIEEDGGRAWLGMPMRGQHVMSVNGVTIKAEVWQRLLELGDLEVEEGGDGGNNVYVLLTAQGRQKLTGECSVEGCHEEATSRGWCRTHYNRWYRHGDTDQLRPSNEEFKALHYGAAIVDDGFWDQVERSQRKRILTA